MIGAVVLGCASYTPRSLPSGTADTGSTIVPTPTGPRFVSARQADIFIKGMEDNDHFGEGVCAGPDFDGDGRMDLFVGAMMATFGTDQREGYVAWIASSAPQTEFEYLRGGQAAAGTGVHLGSPLAGGAHVLALGSSWDRTRFLSVDHRWANRPEVASEAHTGSLDLYAWGLEVGPDANGNGLDDLVLGTMPPNTEVLAFDIDPLAHADHEWEDAAWLRFERDVDHLEEGVWAVAQEVAGPADLDGDGLAEVLFTGWGPQGSMAYLQYMPTSGTMSMADTDVRLEGTLTDGVQRMAAVGDLDDDGLPDVMVGAPHLTYTSADGPGRVYAWLGAPARGSQPIADAPIRIDGPESGFGMAVEAAGDTNGDGHDDFLMSTLGVFGGGEVHLAHGPLGPGRYDLADVLALNITSEGERYIGWEMAPLGDFDGDGTDDFVLGGPSLVDVPGAAYVFLGPR